MKKHLVLAACMVGLLGTLAQAAVKPSYDRFYGKITNIDVPSKMLTVHNKKKQMDQSFAWDAETNISLKKNPIEPRQLTVGQFLMVSYVKEGNGNKAKAIVVRAPSTSKKAVTE